jgi:hypothetical protein
LCIAVADSPNVPVLSYAFLIFCITVVNLNRRLWSSSYDSSPDRGTDQEHSYPNISSHHGMKSNSLQVHCDDFFSTVLHLMHAGCYPFPSYFPLVEGVLTSAQKGQEPGDTFMQHRNLDSCGNMTGGEGFLWDPKSAFLNSKLKFTISSATLPKLTSRSFPTIWKEFTSTQGLVPHNLMFVGGPHCGQTETAKAVAMMYGEAQPCISHIIQRISKSCPDTFYLLLLKIISHPSPVQAGSSIRGYC